MVIFGKKARELVRRVDELENYVNRIKAAQDEHFETLFAIKRELIDRIKELECTKRLQANENMAIGEKFDKLEAWFRELALTVENSLDNGEPRKTPQQLLKEWFLGNDEEGNK